MRESIVRAFVDLRTLYVASEKPALPSFGRGCLESMTLMIARWFALAVNETEKAANAGKYSRRRKILLAGMKAILRRGYESRKLLSSILCKFCGVTGYVANETKAPLPADSQWIFLPGIPQKQSTVGIAPTEFKSAVENRCKIQLFCKSQYYEFCL